MEPQHFCQAFPRENDTLVVVIRNEDIASHLHQVRVVIFSYRVCVLGILCCLPNDQTHRRFSGQK